MPRAELIEWIVMILIIVLMWPMIFIGWAPPAYRYSVYAVSLVALAIILRRRLVRVNEGFGISEKMMQARFEAERQARGGDPSLDEKTPPDVSGRLPFPTTPPTGDDKGPQP